MKKCIKILSVLGLAFFLLMQMYQPARNESYEQVNTVDFTTVYQVPKNVETLIRTSCYDCHSNNTHYPWYSYIQPARFYMEIHIKNGKKSLNFDEYGNYSERKKNNKLDRIVKQIKSNEMPLSSYILIHKNAVLSDSKKEEIINWVNSVKQNE